MEEDTHMATYESHKVFLLRTVYTHSLSLQVLMTGCTHCGWHCCINREKTSHLGTSMESVAWTQAIESHLYTALHANIHHRLSKGVCRRGVVDKSIRQQPPTITNVTDSWAEHPTWETENRTNHRFKSEGPVVNVHIWLNQRLKEIWLVVSYKVQH